MNDLPTAPLKRILKKYAIRVSEDALIAYQKEVEDYAHDLAEQTAKATAQANRKTVTAQDIEFITKL